MKNSVWGRFPAVAKGLLVDSALLGGVGAVTLGAWEIYRPAGLVTLGLFLLAGGWLGARREAGAERRG